MRTESQIAILIKSKFRWIIRLLILVVSIVIVHTLAFPVFRVSSSSMAPGLLKDDFVMVSRMSPLFSSPSRFDVVVFRPEKGRDTNIKRVVGLPGERIEIEAGECFINGELLTKTIEEQDRVKIPVFLSDRSSQKEFEAFFQRKGGVWSFEDETVVLTPSPGESCRINNRHEINDGIHEVGDLVLELRVRPTGEGSLELVLQDGSRVITAKLAVGEAGLGSFVMLGSAAPESLNFTALPAGQESLVRFASVDDRVSLLVDNQVVFTSPGIYRARRSEESKKIDRRVWSRIGVKGHSIRFEEIRLYRDVFYVESGTWGVRESIHIPEGEYFLLGDNSRVSQDSRMDGPIKEETFVGSAMSVVWPFGRLRGL